MALGCLETLTYNYNPDLYPSLLPLHLSSQILQPQPSSETPEPDATMANATQPKHIENLGAREQTSKELNSHGRARS